MLPTRQACSWCGSGTGSTSASAICGFTFHGAKLDLKGASLAPDSVVPLLMGASVPMLDADTLQNEHVGEGGQLGGEKQICTYLINSGMA